MSGLAPCPLKVGWEPDRMSPDASSFVSGARRTVTSPSASVPRVIDLTWYSSSVFGTCTIRSIARYMASTGPTPMAASTLSTPSLLVIEIVAVACSLSPHDTAMLLSFQSSSGCSSSSLNIAWMSKSVTLFFESATFFERGKGAVHSLIRQVVVSEFNEARTEGVASRMLPEDEVALQSHCFRSDDFVCLLMLEHAVLVNARFVRKCIGSHNGLVGLHDHASVRRDHSTRSHNLRRVNLGVHGKVLCMRVNGHNDLFQRCVSRSLANAVDCDLHLPRSIAHSCESVCSCKPKVIVAVGRPHDLVCAGRVFHEVSDNLPILLRGVVPDRIRDVQSCRAGFNGRTQNSDKKVPVAASSILGAKLDVGAETTRIGHGPLDLGNALLARYLQLVLQMDVACCKKSVDAVEGSVADGVVGAIDVLLLGPCKSAYYHWLCGRTAIRQRSDFGRNAPHRIEISFRGNREPGLAYCHTQPRQLARNLNLLVARQRHSRRLFAVTQSGIEYHEKFFVRGSRIQTRPFGRSIHFSVCHLCIFLIEQRGWWQE
eukprot:Opistho-2@70777